MKKRILPALLALCMVMSLLPVALAAGANGCTCDGTEANCKKFANNTAAHQADGCTGTPAQGETVCADCKKDASSGGGDPVDPPSETTYTCACPGYNGCSHTIQDGKSVCTTEVDNEGDLCETCQGKKTAAEEAAKKEVISCTHSHDESTPKPAGCPGVVTLTEEQQKTMKIKTVDKCDACLKSITCSPCEKDGCKLPADHPEKHTLTTCTQDTRCNASTGHNASCPLACGNSANVGDGKPGASGCTLTKGHSAKHNISSCLGASNTDMLCPGDANGLHTKGCVNFVLCPTCQIGMTEEQVEALTKCKGHTGDHENKQCLGYNDDGHCGATDHIAGCSKYCTCTDHEGCTHKAGCPVCTADAECVCPVCNAKPGPAMGTVTDENGNPVDPADPTEPTTPTKAEDFTDMEDWMVADVQTALDKGWLQGEGETFNGRGVTTGATIATVLARMDGEEITGATWSEDALKWAEGKDVFEDIELTKESLARKDLVLVIWRMAGKPESEKALDDFTDVDGLEGDHLTAMQWAVENGIVKGNGDGTITPDGSVTRAALCAMLARYDGLEK